MYRSLEYIDGIGRIRPYLIGLIIFTLILILSFVPYCRAEKYSPKHLNLDITIRQQPTEKVIRQISRLSGYKIEIDKEYNDIPISLDVQGVDLNRALMEVLRSLKIDNYAILMDEDIKTAAIITFPSFDGANTTFSSPTGDKKGSAKTGHGIDAAYLEKIKQDYYNRTLSPDDILSPPSDDGSKPGMTRRELETIKENYRNRKNQMTGDTIMSPPSSDGRPGMTLAELEALKDRKKQMTGDTIVSPPSPDGKPGMTMAELEALKRKYQLSKE